ncbi:unnamed protein product, partial [Ixodes hexagonus]
DTSAADETRASTGGDEIVPGIEPAEPARSVCTSASCQQFSSIFQLTLLNKTNPCNNFYEYVCGGWRSRHPHEYSVKTGHRQRIVNLMETILLQRQQLAGTDALDDKALFLYKSCMTAKPNQKYLRVLMREGGVMFYDVDGEHPLEKMIRINVQYGVTVLFNIKRSTTVTCAGKGILVFHRVDPGLYTTALERLTKTEDFLNKVFKSVLRRRLPSGIFSDVDAVDRFLLSKRSEGIAMTSTSWFKLADGGLFFANVSLADTFKYLGKYIDQKFEPDDCIGVDSSEVLGTLRAVFGQFGPERLHRYLNWWVLRRAAPMADPGLLGDVSQRHLYCFDNLERVLRQPTSARYLLTLVAPGDGTMRQASNLISAVQDASQFLIRTSEWMNAAEKQAVRRRLDSIRRVLGYSRSHMAVEENLGIALPQNVSSMVALEIWAHELSAARAKQLGEGSAGDEGLHPLGTELMVQADENSLAVPAALLVPPFFGRGGTESVNFGILGTSVAAALLGLAFLGEQNATKVKQGSSGFGRQFKKTKRCLYETYHEAMRVRLAEADLEIAFLEWAALAPALMAFLSMSEGKALRGLEFLSDEQLFFVAYCYSLCENAHAASLGQRPSLASFRCNVPLSMAPQFADAFGCSAKSPMRRNGFDCYFWPI